MGERQAIAYHKEYGMNIAIVRPSNSYGPRDSDDLETAHALGSLIIKAINKMNPFVIWGDGSPIREYIYASDAAKGMLLAMENYCVGDPINLASGEFVSISELAQKILKISNMNPEIKFDKEKPSGQKRRVLSNKKAEEKIGFVAETSLDVGIEQTIKWYKQKLGK
jgi:GDP-L-fucose synthase